jgi:hypothetical protein
VKNTIDAFSKLIFERFSNNGEKMSLDALHEVMGRGGATNTDSKMEYTTQ